MPFPVSLIGSLRCFATATVMLCAFAPLLEAWADVRVGFAARDVSTRSSVPMGGYGVYVGTPQQARLSKGIHDPLLASAVAFEGADGQGVLLVGVDGVGLSAASTRRVRALVGRRIPQERVPLLLSSSHSHATPDGMGLWGALPFFSGRDAAYMALLERGIADAAVAAWSARAPATVTRAATRLPNSSSLAADAGGRHDQVLTLLVRDAQGNVLGTLTQWSAHPTVLPASNRMLSADYVGSFRAFLGAQYEGVHVYLNGAIGNVYPSDPDVRPADPFPRGDRSPDAGRSYEKAAGVGQALSEVVGAALKTASPMQSEAYGSKSATVRFRLRNPLFELASGLNIIETRLLRDKQVETEISLLRLGDLLAIAAPAELFPSAAAELEEVLPAPLVGARHAVIGLANDWLGYVLTDEQMRDPDLAYNRTLSPGSEALPAFRGALQGLAR